MVQGALDGTYIMCLVPLEDKPRYRTRKGEIATNVLGVYSQDMKFIFVLPGWEGSTANGRVLRDALDRLGKRGRDAFEMENEGTEEQEQESDNDFDEVIDASVVEEVSSVRSKKKKKENM
ncbi:ALP1-like protein, partial [Tanacetum coccineum]